MTTAHRPTFYNALGGENQGGNLIVGQTSKVCARDLPGQTQLKTRQVQPPPLYSDPAPSDHAESKSRKQVLKEQLELREKQHQVKKLRETTQRDQPLETLGLETTAAVPLVNKVPRAILADQEVNPFPEDEDDEGPTEAHRTQTTQKKSSNASEHSSDEHDDDDDDDDDEEEQLMRELEKIKREREEEERKKAEEELQRKQEEEKGKALTANPLLMMDGSASNGVLKRRWDDDVVFKNQAKDLPKPKKRFINDTVRSEFHKKFLAKYIH